MHVLYTTEFDGHPIHQIRDEAGDRWLVIGELSLALGYPDAYRLRGSVRGTAHLRLDTDYRTCSLDESRTLRQLCGPHLGRVKEELLILEEKVPLLLGVCGGKYRAAARRFVDGLGELLSPPDSPPGHDTPGPDPAHLDDPLDEVTAAELEPAEEAPAQEPAPAPLPEEDEEDTCEAALPPASRLGLATDLLGTAWWVADPGRRASLAAGMLDTADGQMDGIVAEAAADLMARLEAVLEDWGQAQEILALEVLLQRRGANAEPAPAPVLTPVPDTPTPASRQCTLRAEEAAQQLADVAALTPTRFHATVKDLGLREPTGGGVEGYSEKRNVGGEQYPVWFFSPACVQRVRTHLTQQQGLPLGRKTA